MYFLAVFLHRRRRAGPVPMPDPRDRADRGAPVPAARRKLKIDLGKSELRLGWLEPGGVLSGREKAEAHDVEPGVGEAVQVEKEEAFGGLDGGGEPVENGEPGAEEPVRVCC